MIYEQSVRVNLVAAQRCCACYFDKNVRQEPTFKAEGYKFLDRTTQATVVPNAVDGMANGRCYKHLRRISDLYKPLNPQSHTATVDEDGIPDTVSTDRLTLSPTQTQVTNNPIKTMKTTQQLQDI